MLPISLVIPTYQREQVLVETLQMLHPQRDSFLEVVVVDQTQLHESKTEAFLAGAAGEGWLRWIRLEEASIPKAMNRGICESRGEIVCFLDDDIIPANGLIRAHLEAHAEFPEAGAVAGQVLQPGETSRSRGERLAAGGIYADLDFPFWSNERGWIRNVMAGNLSVKRKCALACGGFDENFKGAAFRFETEFAQRLIAHGGSILFEPAASLRHLRVARGGTRSQGGHQGSTSPIHGLGDYYFAMRHGWNRETISYMSRRPLREVCTRFHARRPWLIPVKLVGELRAFCWAFRLARNGPRLIRQQSVDLRPECPQMETQ